ncbi:HD domain-containing protein [Candidatus Accumulibacter sp. ACC003]|uniref:HD domain-containing protein n=1 Tax=Candidatus Accumulibacter sp. ACC003 TaxID=2823334 RepID=UPI0025BF22D8|nr:HD domain-containing protein [Candidatus Accumulibacter sp. ACC003]
MSELIQRAKNFATSAHQRIGHRRKYSDQPYQVHLEAVARLVASVTDDPEMIAAAWLHDVVEDTPATLGDVEREFGPAVAALVQDLTDVSRPSDGNRAIRKESDRQHTAHASPRAKTIKLADLMDNCQDISRHDVRFARVYLSEMNALLAVLGEGDARLLKKARALHGDCLEKLLTLRDPDPGLAAAGLVSLLPLVAGSQLLHRFREVFTAGDIAEPLLSFDSDAPERTTARIMNSRRLRIAGIRVDGLVQAYVRLSDIDATAAGDKGSDTPSGRQLQHISADQVLGLNAPLMDVVGILTRHDHCFVSVFDSVVGVIGRDAVNKPPVRMWLFGAITLYEMGLIPLIEKIFPDGTWQSVLPPARLEKARELQRERERRNQRCDLINCLQLSDKAQITLEYAPARDALGLPSKRAGKELIKDLESLRNHLAHSQDIVSHDWVQIIRMAYRMAELSPP